MITEKRGRRAVSIDDGVSVFKNFPRRLSYQRNHETPTGRDVLLYDITKQQEQDSRKHEAMHQVREAVRIEKRLRRQRPPRVGRPEVGSAPAPPETTLTVQLPRGGYEDQHDHHDRPNLFLRAIIQKEG